MTIVHAFEASTPFEKLPGTQVTYRGQISIAPAGPPVPHFPRFRALALFGRRPPQRVDSIVMPASENLHRSRRILTGPRGQECPHGASASSKILASFRSSVSKPSENQP